MTVKLRQVGKTIVFTPVAKKKNIFATKDWENCDYHKDIANDQFLQPVKLVGQAIIG
ncbi:hypothetical protein H5W18_08580 [Lactobacillus sp. Marseille-P7033]|nr:hypothetical protein [Lactobacillus sp. Marseille-P7033]